MEMELVFVACAHETGRGRGQGGLCVLLPFSCSFIIIVVIRHLIACFFRAKPNFRSPLAVFLFGFTSL